VKKDQRIIITGGSGFIGSFLIETLIKKGFTAVTVLDKNPQPQTGATHLTCNVFRDVHLLKEHITEGSIVVHLACTTIPSVSEKDSAMDAQENIAGTLRLMDVCREKKVRKFIFASSGGTVYGNSSRKPHTEKDATEPENSYGAIKLALEKYLGVYEHLYGMKHAILRISNPYGRRKLVSTKLGAVDIFLRHSMENKTLSIWGDGKNVRDYIHISDVVNFIIHTIKRDDLTGIYNVGTGVGTSLNQIVDCVSNILKRPITPNYNPARGVDVRHNVLDIKKAKKTGWRPEYTLSKGIRTLYREIQKT